jgi:hypothetical protein
LRVNNRDYLFPDNCRIKSDEALFHNDTIKNATALPASQSVIQISY